MASRQTKKTDKKILRSRIPSRGTTKTVEKPVDKSVAKEPKGQTGLTISVLGIDGKSKGRMTLPSEVFGVTPHKQLMAQAVRVYLANQREGSASTKTRGEVEGSTRKIYRQKGTGRARHGSIRAPIFVGGGIVFGPVPHGFTMAFPVKMKRKALASALSTQLASGNIVVVDGLGGLTKTKSMAKALTNAGISGSTLLVLSSESGTAFRTARNIEDIDVLPAKSLNTYAVLTHQKIVFMKDAVSAVGNYSNPRSINV